MSVSRIFSSMLTNGKNIRLLRKCSSHNGVNIADTAVQSFLKNMTAEHDILSSKTERTPEESKRLFEIKPIVKILERRNNLSENIEMLKNYEDQRDDNENKIEGEIQGYMNRMTAVDRELQTILLEPQYTEGSALLELSASTDKQETMVFVEELFEMYRRYAEYKDWEIYVISQQESEAGGIEKVSMFVEGVGVPELLTTEAGLHRVIKTFENESGRNVHTSTVLVAVMVKPTDKEVNIAAEDIYVENVSYEPDNNLYPEAAVRITHTPTGTVVECQDTQSYKENADIALKKMGMILLGKQLKAQSNSSTEHEEIRTYSFPENIVTDHRMGGLTYKNLQDFMNGENQLEFMQEYFLRENIRKDFLDQISQFTKEFDMKSADNM
ncbi:peptide chain release factor 1-like [Helicoverpa zea]|uniref:peptide chain release factor 1-like n=1 Tax=Helicoverpa zea TaxID=7113 RepID=UPI001F5664B5|nr:peptide chain release factor 1-like [Helicoverpa zea]